MFSQRGLRALVVTLLSGAALGVCDSALGLTCTWTGASSTNWSTAGNWNNCGGLTPQPGDTAIIANVGNLPTLSAAATVAALTLNTGATLTIAGAGNLTLNGNADGDGNLTVSGTLTWSGGTMSGAGTTTVNPGGTLTLLNNATRTLSRVFNNSGTATMSGTSPSFSISGGAFFNNLAPGTFVVQNDPNIFGAGTFNNVGTFNRNTSAGVMNVSALFPNSGAVNVATGTLRFNGGTSTHGGTYTFTGTHLEFTGGTHTINASMTGTDLLIGTTVTFNAAATLTNQVADLEVTSTATFNTGEALTFQTLNHNSGTIDGSDSISSPAWTWTGGTLSGTGTASVPPGGTLTLFNNATRTLSRVFNNSGTATMSGTSPSFSISGGAFFNNLAPGTFVVQNDPNIFGAGTFNNVGTFNRNTSVGVMNVSALFPNSGAVNVATGTLRFNGGTSTHGGTYTFTGTHLEFTGGTHTINASMTGTDLLIGTTVTFNAAATLTNQVADLEVTSTATFNTGEALTFQTLNHNSGTIDGSDSISSPAWTWTGGTLSGTGTASVPPGGTLTLFNNATRTLSRVFNNSGTATMSGTSPSFSISGGAFFNNLAPGTFVVQNDPNIFGVGTFNNVGTFNRNTSVGVMNVSALFPNSGAVNVATGTLRFNGGTSTHGGTYTFTGTHLEFTGGTHTINASMTGTDLLIGTTVTFNAAATLTNQVADLEVTSTATFNTGEALTFQTLNHNSGTIDGSDSISSPAWTWTGGTLSGTGTASVPPGGTLTLFNNATRTLSRVFNNSGTATMSGTSPSFSISGGAFFNNLAPGTFVVQNDPNIFGVGTFNNVGTFNRNTSVGVMNVSALFPNSGAVNVATGTLRFNGGTSTHGGTYTFTGTHLEFTGGTHTINASMTGTDLLIGTTVTFNAAATLTNQVADLEVTSTATFNTGEALTFQTLNHNSGTIDGSDSISSPAWTWTGGTLSGTGTASVPPGGTLTLFNNATRTLSRVFNNSGTATMSGTSPSFSISGGAFFNNLAPGTFIVQNDPNINGAGTFNNVGTFNRNTSTVNATVSAVMSNTGAVTLSSGNLTVSNFTQTAGTTTLNGGNITAQTNPLRIQGGSLTGTGTITGNVLASAGAHVAPGFSPGTATISGTYTQSPPAAFDAEINAAGAGNFDVIAVGGQATIGGVLNVPALPFTPVAGNNFPLMTYSSRVGEFGTLNLPALPGGLSWLTRYSATQFSLRVQALLPDVPMRVDTQAPSVGSPNVNGVIDPGENVVVAPRWRNPTFGPIAFTGTASNLTGPAGATYAITDASAGYGTINGNDGENDCILATGNCYEMSVSNPATRPAAHWDVTFDEALSNGDVSSWTLHVGASFNDVSQTESFYRFIETLFHVQITGGCGGGAFCPLTTVTRGQMSVFLLKSRFGAAYVPPAGTGTIFADVPLSNPFVAFIEDLAARGVTGGCGGGNYCPDANATREQMAVFLLVMLEGMGYQPPACVTPTFNDVPCTSGFARWIEELFRRGITGGCGGGAYCPTSPVTRGQMAVFLTVTYALRVNGP